MDQDGELTQTSHTLDMYKHIQIDKAFNHRCSESLIEDEYMENTYYTSRNIYTRHI
jgi:hypothetical protein